MALLTALLIEGQAVGVDHHSWGSEQPPFLIEDTVSAGYQDISSIENWHLYGFTVEGKDYVFVRDRIKEMVEQAGIDNTLGTESDPTNISSPATDDAYLVGASAVGDFATHEGEIAIWNGSSWDFQYQHVFGFDHITVPEKVIATEHKIGSHAQRVSIVGLDNVIKLGLQYHALATESRQTRTAYAVSEVHNRLPTHANEVMHDLISLSDNIFITYVFFGIEGTTEDGPWDSPANQPNGVVDYLYGYAEHNGAGLVNKGWTPEGMADMQELCDKLYDILIKGIY